MSVDTIITLWVLAFFGIPTILALGFYGILYLLSEGSVQRTTTRTRRPNDRNAPTRSLAGGVLVGMVLSTFFGIGNGR